MFAVRLNPIQSPAPGPDAGFLLTIVIVEPIGDDRWSVIFPWLNLNNDTEVTVEADGLKATCACPEMCMHLGAVTAWKTRNNSLEVML